MVSVTSASRYITTASCYNPRYQSRSSMYIRGLIPRNFAELAEAVPIDFNCGVAPCVLCLFLTGPWIGLKPVAFPDHTYVLENV